MNDCFHKGFKKESKSKAQAELKINANSVSGIQGKVQEVEKKKKLGKSTKSREIIKFAGKRMQPTIG